MDLDPRLSARLRSHGGVGSVSEMAEVGVSRHVVQRAVKSGHLIRLRRNVVALADVWASAQPWERHALLAKGVVRACDRANFALSHQSALALHGIPVHGVDHRVHLVHRNDGVCRTGPMTAIFLPVAAKYLQKVDGMWAVAAPLAVLQVAATSGIESGLVSADALLRSGTTDLAHALADLPRGNGFARAAQVVSLADGRIESVGESRCRWAMRTAGLPDPEPQVWVRDGGFAARVDFLLADQRVIIEFDGMVKYQSPADLRAEKVREDRLRSLGYEVVRVTWKDLECTEQVHAMISAAIHRSAERLRLN
ncbi:MAG: type IV toxin-antitoxin system AbiEi family antitoxin domain-containing protein [Ornithinimicrobium sp.]